MRRVLDAGGVAALLDALKADGHRLVGPTVRDGAIVVDELQGAGELPAGVGEEQEAGRYRLRERGDRALFGFSSGPQSFKQHLFVPRVRLFQIRRQGRSFTATPDEPPRERLAFIGVRACDLAAIGVQDRTFLDGPYRDPDYARRREGVFVVAVNCGQAGGTCFCASMETGPRVREAFDLALTELDEAGAHHRFVVEVGSERGRALLDRVPTAEATDDDTRAADARVEETARHMGRTLDTRGLKERLFANPEHPRWDDVATRCLSCTNCTLVCPTCFCASVEDTSDLAGETAERWRRWDSCFTLGHSYLHGGSVRSSLKARYRQWLTHKLSTWWDQFGVSGCVGCGRCITWCPVGIDITEEAAAITGHPAPAGAPHPAPEAERSPTP